jgi:hypothetical protein
LTAVETCDDGAQVETTMIPRPRAAAMGRRGLECLKEFPNVIYPLAVGGAEWNGSMAPRCKTACSCCNLVRPNCSNWWHRDENLDQLCGFGGTEYECVGLTETH